MVSGSYVLTPYRNCAHMGIKFFNNKVSDIRYLDFTGGVEDAAQDAYGVFLEIKNQGGDGNPAAYNRIYADCGKKWQPGPGDGDYLHVNG